MLHNVIYEMQSQMSSYGKQFDKKQNELTEFPQVSNNNIIMKMIMIIYFSRIKIPPFHGDLGLLHLLYLKKRVLDIAKHITLYSVIKPKSSS